MKRILWVLAMGLTATLLVFTACKKQEATTATDPTSETDTSKGADVAKAVAAAAAEAAKNTNVGDAPDYMKKSVDFIKDINKLMKDNMSDCAKATEMVNKYVEEHKTELDALKKATDDATAKMTDDEKMKLGQQMLGLMAPVMQEVAQTQMEFSQKCASEAQKIGEAMKKLSSK
jgi:hypothetical protein